jgi:hypothetical protein
MEKGRTYFEQDAAFLKEMAFDTVKIDQCGSAMNMSLWAALINATVSQRPVPCLDLYLIRRFGIPAEFNQCTNDGDGNNHVTYIRDTGCGFCGLGRCRTALRCSRTVTTHPRGGVQAHWLRRFATPTCGAVVEILGTALVVLTLRRTSVSPARPLPWYSCIIACVTHSSRKPPVHASP